LHFFSRRRILGLRIFFLSYNKKSSGKRKEVVMKKEKESHEWIIIEDNIATVGITAYARKEIGEIVNLDLPKVGRKVRLGEEICVIESTKSAIDIYSPLSGKIVEVNGALIKDVGLINRSPEKEGWLFKIEATDLKELEGRK
jgi:glycine cleavage system H protein